MAEAKIFFFLTLSFRAVFVLLCFSFYSNCYDCVINKDEGGQSKEGRTINSTNIFFVVAYHVYLFVNVFHSSQNTYILKIMQMLSFRIYVCINFCI